MTHDPSDGLPGVAGVGEKTAARLVERYGGLDGILASPSWAKPHVRTRGGWMSLMPKPTYYRVSPAAGVNASASDMAQWLLAHTGHRPDVLPAPLLATLHQPLVETPSEMRGSAWRRERLYGASYALGWRVYDYAGSQLVFHGGAVQGYRGVVALLPDRDLGIALLWNSESLPRNGMAVSCGAMTQSMPESCFVKSWLMFTAVRRRLMSVSGSPWRCAFTS